MFFVISLCIFIGLVLCKIFMPGGTARNHLRGKLALVTGGANGLGQQICIELARLGCNVAIADIDFQSAEKTSDSLVQLGVSARAYKVDVSNSEEIEKLKATISSDLGEVDILVNNAGLIPYQSILEQTAEDVERLTKVNFNSVLLMTKCFLGDMIKRQSGHIVTIASLQGIYAYPFSISYCATKFGVTGFMLALIEYLRLEKLSDHIHATCILPDVIATRDDIIALVNPKFRLLKPEYVARKTVEAILGKQRFVTVPWYTGISIQFFNILPFFVQHFIRDYLRQESTFIIRSS